MTGKPRKSGQAEPDALAQARQELASGTWNAKARARAQRRKSWWNLLLPALAFPLWGATTFALVWAAYLVRVALLGDSRTLRVFMDGPMHASTLLVLIPSLLAGVAPAFLLTNFLVNLISPARLAMNAESRNFPSTAYGPSQVALARITGWLLLGWAVCTLLACAFP